MGAAIGVIILVGVGLAALGVLLWWLIFESEGVYLGRRVVVWLYDIYAGRYDAIKQNVPEYDHWLIAAPIMTRIAPHRSPLMLDAATGTGRLPLSIINHQAFQGRVVGVDLSRRMLHRAAQKLDGHPRISLLWVSADDLPFDDGTFDVVTCLEALEFTPYPARTLTELVRVLRPGGLLLVSNRMTRWMPGKTWEDDRIAELLFDLDMASVDVELWQQDYKKVWAVKSGSAEPTGARPLAEILRCPRCSGPMITQDSDWRCENCGSTAKIADDGVIELAKV